VTLSQHTAVEEAAATPGVTRAGIRGAVAGASAPVLRFLFPTEGATIDSVLLTEQGAISQAQRAEFDAARTAAEAVAARAVARAASDGFSATWTGTIPTGPGKWASLSKPPAPPLLPLGGQIHPIVMSSGSQFRPGPPPVYGSAAFQEALAEVRRISDTRTSVQDSLAKFWAVPSGSLIAGLWNRIAIGMISGDRLGERASAHALALMNSAGWDALIACHDAKYVYWLVRPSGADTAIHTSVGVPNHPSYPSNHSCLAGASAEALGSVFPAQRERLQQMANEASLSRLYGGIHYRFDMDAGLAISRELGVLVREVDARGGLRRVLQ
jgi:hypothetical protein